MFCVKNVASKKYEAWKIQNMQFYYRLPWMIKWKKILSLYCKKVYCKYCVNNCIAQCNKRVYNLWCGPLFVRLLGEIHRFGGVNISQAMIKTNSGYIVLHLRLILILKLHTQRKIVQFIEGNSIIHVLWSLFRITGGPSFFGVWLLLLTMAFSRRDSGICRKESGICCPSFGDFR